MVQIHLNGDIILSYDSVYKEDVIQHICDKMDLKRAEFYLVQNGKTLSNQDVNNLLPIHIQLRVLGGKGGFGSMLRAIGAQIEKTTNREACRDLSGRRLRDINEEKRLKAWLEKQKDREAEAEEKKKKKVEKLLHVPKHEFKDPKYEETRSKLTEKVNDSVEEGFKKAIEKQEEKPNLKRKGEQISKVKNKKSALWLDVDDISSGTDSDDSNESDCEKPSTSKKNYDNPSTSNKNI